MGTLGSYCNWALLSLFLYTYVEKFTSTPRRRRCSSIAKQLCAKNLLKVSTQ